METKVDTALKSFMGVTAKSTVAVVVPLYGFWGDVPDNPVNGTVLKTTLERLYSSVHHLYIIFVAHPSSLPGDPSQPGTVTNILLARAKMGNVMSVPVTRDASYSDYVIAGLDAAVNETNAQFMMVFNPWVMIQQGAIDVIVDRCNRADDAKVVSGYDLRSVIVPENFDQYRNQMPSEEYDLSFDFLAMPRYVAEMVELDPTFQTHAFLQRDLWQQVMRASFAVVASQRVPIFPFDFPWSDYEKKEAFQSDRAYFTQKWGFDPGINYADTRGVSRKDKGTAERT